MTDQQQPLWEVLRDARHHLYQASIWRPSDDEYAAAEIEALADWLVPEESEPVMFSRNAWDELEVVPTWTRWEQRQQIRQRLLDEALRARGGGQS